MRYSGEVGYVKDQVETQPGIWEPFIQKVVMKGYAESVTSRNSFDDKVNDDISTSHRLRVIGDKFAFSNFMYIRFAEFMGEYWEVNSVQIMRPNIILNLGGLYNGQTD